MTDPVLEAIPGRKNPFLEMLGARVRLREKGRVVLTLEMRPELLNTWNIAHGGVLMTLLDVAMGSAGATADDGAQGVVSVNLSVSFLRPATGPLTAEGRMVSAGRSIVFCEGDVRDQDGTLVAKGQGTFKLKRRAASPSL
ncbi:MAG: PaaI family thioesterase [Myxococcales bacterium]